MTANLVHKYIYIYIYIYMCMYEISSHSLQDKYIYTYIYIYIYIAVLIIICRFESTLLLKYANSCQNWTIQRFARAAQTRVCIF